MRKAKRILMIAGIIAVLAVVLFALVGVIVSRGGSGGETGSTDGSGAGSTPFGRELGQPYDYGAAEVAGGGGDGTGGVAGDEPTESLAAKETDASGAVPPELAYGPDPLSPARFLVRTGDITIHVDEGEVPDAAARVTALATGYNGYVVSSQITMAGEGTRPYATITVKVPSRSYDQAIARLSELGKVAALHTGTEDVTGQYVDVGARLKHYRAVERRLLSFLTKATTIGEALSVQERIDATQLKVEQLAGQLKAMRNQIAYGTLTVAVTEPPEKPAAQKKDDDSFVGALGDSWRLIVKGFSAIVVGFGAVLPFLVLIVVLAAAVWYGARLVWRLRGRRVTHAV